MSMKRKRSGRTRNWEKPLVSCGLDFDKIMRLESKLYSQVFSRVPIAIAKGKGAYVWDIYNEKYLDFFSGIAVNSVGHCHPEVVKAIKKQTGTLMHTSNWLYTLPQLELASKLVELTKMKKVFLTNSGTESVECAIKLARKTTGKKEIIAMENDFHGRSMGALSLTWGKKYRTPFEPLIPCMKFVEYNNIDKLKKAISKKTSAVILEPIQSESGILLPDDGFLTDVRELTEKKNVLLILDEVTTCFGRTGKMFAFQHENVIPDVLCLGKGMGGGFPISATLFNCNDFERGEHGGTFVGNPLACSAAMATIDVITKENLVKNSEKIGKYILKSLKDSGYIARGKGLMIGIDVKNGRKTSLDLIKHKILTIYSGDTLRLLPPLIINNKQADQFLSALDSLTF